MCTHVLPAENCLKGSVTIHIKYQIQDQLPGLGVGWLGDMGAVRLLRSEFRAGWGSLPNTLPRGPSPVPLLSVPSGPSAWLGSSLHRGLPLLTRPPSEKPLPQALGEFHPVLPCAAHRNNYITLQLPIYIT